MWVTFCFASVITSFLQHQGEMKSSENALKLRETERDQRSMNVLGSVFLSPPTPPDQDVGQDVFRTVQLLRQHTLSFSRHRRSMRKYVTCVSNSPVHGTVENSQNILQSSKTHTHVTKQNRQKPTCVPLLSVMPRLLVTTVF